jgi:hypothetical protein
MAVALLIAAHALAVDPARSSPSGLMCDLLAAPERTRVVNPRPRFSWVMNANDADEVQSAYRIEVVEGSADFDRKPLWDSGKVVSDQSTAVEFGGAPLTPGHSYRWRVQTWDRHGASGDWSAIQSFTIAEVSPGSALRTTTAEYPLQQSDGVPISVTQSGDGHYLADFGRDAFGSLRLTLATEASQSVTVELGEALKTPDQIDPKPGGSIRYLKVALKLDPGKHSYIVPLGKKDDRRIPPDIGSVMPFRYVSVAGISGLSADMVHRMICFYPFDDTASHFNSSDADLNQVWDLCAYSMKVTPFTNVFVDGDRERKPYEADAYLAQLGRYCCDREYTLARYSGEYLLQNPTWPTEWLSHSIFIAWADYLYTGDDRSLREFYPDLKARALVELEHDGLISTVQPRVPKAVSDSLHGDKIKDLVDWPVGERDGYEMRPVNTVVNAFHYRALVLMAQIADAVGQPGDAATFRSHAAQTLAAFNQRLFDAGTGLYVDGEGSQHSSIHANMFPLAFGMVPTDRSAKVAAFVAGRGMACSVYGAQYLLEALYAADDADAALALLDSKSERSWLHMLAAGATMTMEAWDNQYKPNQDWNHAWGAAPANVIPRLLMGIEPLQPGFGLMRIRPQLGTLQRASIDLPTIRGTVHEEVESSGAEFVLKCTLPANTAAEVYLPMGGSKDLTVDVDGTPRTGRADGIFTMIDHVGSGTHVLRRKLD